MQRRGLLSRLQRAGHDMRREEGLDVGRKLLVGCGGAVRVLVSVCQSSAKCSEKETPFGDSTHGFRGRAMIARSTGTSSVVSPLRVRRDVWV